MKTYLTNLEAWRLKLLIFTTFKSPEIIFTFCLNIVNDSLKNEQIIACSCAEF